MTSTTITGERADLLETLAEHRQFRRPTARDLTGAQAAARSTVSELCVGGLIKHVATTEDGWAKFVIHGPDAQGPLDEAADEAAASSFRMLPGEAPGNPPGARCSARRVFLHIIAGTAQHAGHADIIREAIDGAKTMG